MTHDRPTPFDPFQRSPREVAEASSQALETNMQTSALLRSADSPTYQNATRTAAPATTEPDPIVAILRRWREASHVVEKAQERRTELEVAYYEKAGRGPMAMIAGRLFTSESEIDRLLASGSLATRSAQLKAELAAAERKWWDGYRAACGEAIAVE
jgi:hypothetical protein